MKDYYATLGVAKSASADEIKRAYRRLASQHHPDKGGDTARFQDIEEAYRVLGDPAARQQYDNPQPQFASPFGSQGFNFNDIFSVFANQGFGQHPRRNHARAIIWISFLDAVKGGSRTLSLGTRSGNVTVEIQIPQGIDDGDNVQYANLGPDGMDLVIEFRIRPDPKWQRQGLDVTTEIPVSIWQLVLGGDLQIKDPYDADLVGTIAPGTQPNTLLRLRARGIKNQKGQQGDLYVKLSAFIPKDINDALVEAIRSHGR